VQSPNLSFLGTPTLSRLSNSFLNSSFRAKTPEVISNLVKPLLRPTSDEQEQQQQQHEDARKSSQYILPSSRKPSLDQIPEDRKPVVIAHELSPYQKCSYTQGVMNGKHQTTLLYNFLKYVLSYMNCLLVKRLKDPTVCCMHTCLAVMLLVLSIHHSRWGPQSLVCCRIFGRYAIAELNLGMSQMSKFNVWKMCTSHLHFLHDCLVASIIENSTSRSMAQRWECATPFRRIVTVGVSILKWT
jgi:hypothetical protein